MAISQCSPAWIEQLRKGSEEDACTKQLLTELSLTPENDKGFHLSNGVLRYKGRVLGGQQ